MIFIRTQDIAASHCFESTKVYLTIIFVDLMLGGTLFPPDPPPPA
jgi:hypothetical protein